MAAGPSQPLPPDPRFAQLARSRPRRGWKRRFIETLRDTANVRLSCEAARVTRAGAYKARDSDAKFAAKWDEAIEEAVDLLEAEARRRAFEGVAKLKFYEGVLITIPDPTQPEGTPDSERRQIPAIDKNYSDGLMMLLLKAHRSEKYRDNHKVTVDGRITTNRTAGERESEAARLLAEIAAAVGVPPAPAPADPPAPGGQSDRAGGDPGKP